MAFCSLFDDLTFIDLMYRREAPWHHTPIVPAREAGGVPCRPGSSTPVVLSLLERTKRAFP